MKSAPFSYMAASSPDDAVAALQELGDDAKVLAGGQSLLTLMNLRVAQPTALIDIARCGLGRIELGSSLEIGATATQNAAFFSSDVRRCAPLLTRAIADVGHHTLRNRGTVGGSIAHADPAAEIPAAVMALGGEMVIRGPGGERVVAADEFAVSHYTTTLADDELLTAVRLPPTPPAAWAFHEIARRHGDFALAGVAATFGLREDHAIVSARVVLFAVDERPVRAQASEAALLGSRIGDADAANAAAALAADEISPVSDLHGSSDFRKKLTRVAVRRALDDVTTEGSPA